MADNYCVHAFGSTLKLDESLNSINAHLSHQLTTYTEQFLLSLPTPILSPPWLRTWSNIAYVLNIPIPIVYCNPKTITIMQHNYISEKLGNNGKPKRDADPAN